MHDDNDVLRDVKNVRWEDAGIPLSTGMKASGWGILALIATGSPISAGTTAYLVVDGHPYWWVYFMITVLFVVMTWNPAVAIYRTLRRGTYPRAGER